MGMVGIAMTVPTIVFLLIGGVASDRLDRRRLMLAADIARLLAAAALATLSLTGALEVWHVAFLVAVYGTGQAFFAPAFDAIVPDLSPSTSSHRPTRSTSSCGRSRCGWLGPAVGGVLVGAARRGRRVRARRAPASPSPPGRCCSCARPSWHARPRPAGSVLGDLRDGWRFVRERRWLWVTFASAAFAYLLFMGPVEVLVPYVVKHDLDGAATRPRADLRQPAGSRRSSPRLCSASSDCRAGA